MVKPGRQGKQVDVTILHKLEKHERMQQFRPETLRLIRRPDTNSRENWTNIKLLNTSMAGHYTSSTTIDNEKHELILSILENL